MASQRHCQETTSFIMAVPWQHKAIQASLAFFVPWSSGHHNSEIAAYTSSDNIHVSVNRDPNVAVALLCGCCFALVSLR